MNKIQFTLLISIMLFGTIENSNAQPMSNLKKEQIEKQVDSIFHAMVKAAETLNYDEISKGVDDRRNAGFIVNRLYYPNYSSLIEQLELIKPEGAHQSITIENEKITVLSDRFVLLSATGKAQAEINTGQIFNSGFLWSFVYEKINNDWKVIQSHQSNTK